MAQVTGTYFYDFIVLGSGSQTVDAGNSSDHILIYSDGGEPIPAQTGNPDDRAHPPVAPGAADDVITGGSGSDTFEFRLLIDAKDSVIAAHTNLAGDTDWGGVAGENDNEHDHWVESIGNDVITDYSQSEGDKIVIKGHTTQVKSITYGSDAQGGFSLVTLYSQQGDGGAAGANTATGAHDEDELGTIKVYGDTVTLDDLHVYNSTEGIDRLEHADATIANTPTQLSFLNTNGASYYGDLTKLSDKVFTGLGAQTVDAGGGDDVIYSFSDSGEPDPAQTNGDEGRVTSAVNPADAVDILKGGQGRDTFSFGLFLNAKPEILAEHTRDDGSINWRRVAGENDNVHDHWVEGIGNDVILDFSNQDGDRIEIFGHTVELASITQGEDDGGQFSLISLRSQQGDNGGAHDEDPLGTIKVYGDVVTEENISVKSSVFYGVDELDELAALETPSVPAPVIEEIQYGADNPESILHRFEGTSMGDTIKLGSGRQVVSGGEGHDRIISFADAGEPDPAQTTGGDGRINPAITQRATMDYLTGGAGADRFEFHALLNGRREVIEQHTKSDGDVNWGGVAGENDNVHDHWVEGIGFDVILDYSKTEGDKIIVRGHTVEIASITYGTAQRGDFSLINLRSQQGDGGAGGANTETGAHDEDSLGKIKVFGDRVELEDICIEAAGVVDGADRLIGVDELAAYNGGVQQFFSNTNGDTITPGSATIDTVDHIVIGGGVQTVYGGVGRDEITSYSDAGEPDPAQTVGSDGRQTPAVDPALTDDVISGGQGRDTFTFNFLLNATEEIRAKHTREDGSINWVSVAGENDAPHLHWVEGIGNDVILDFSKQDGDKIYLRGHTVEVASVTYMEGTGPTDDHTIITLRSQQGDNGGAHDEDPLGTITVYGDRVEEEDLKVSNMVFDGVDRFEDGVSAVSESLVYGTDDAEVLLATRESDVIHGESGSDYIRAGTGDDFIYGGSGRDTIFGSAGNDFIDGGSGNDLLFGGTGSDILFVRSGLDILFGGPGADIFRFGNGWLEADIMDWTDGADKIDFSRIDSVQDISDLFIDVQGANRSEIHYVDDEGRETLISVVNIGTVSLDATDFLF